MKTVIHSAFHVLCPELVEGCILEFHLILSVPPALAWSKGAQSRGVPCPRSCTFRITNHELRITDFPQP